MNEDNNNQNNTEQAVNYTDLLAEVMCKWCNKPILTTDKTIEHRTLGLTHQKCANELDNDAMNALCGFYSDTSY